MRNQIEKKEEKENNNHINNIIENFAHSKAYT